MMPETDNTPRNNDFLYHLLYLSRGTERLEKLGVPVSFKKGQVLNEINTVPEYCYVVKTGRVICYEYSYDGDVRVYNIMEPGSLFLEDCLLFDQPCPIQFKTIEDSKLVRIKKCDLKRAFKKDIDIVMDVCEALSSKFLAAMEYLRLGPKQSASWKICKILLIYAEHYGDIKPDGSCILKKKLSQQMMAELLGLNRVTVARKLKELKELGLVESVSGKLYFKDLSALEEYMSTVEDPE